MSEANNDFAAQLSECFSRVSRGPRAISKYAVLPPHYWNAEPMPSVLVAGQLASFCLKYEFATPPMKVPRFVENVLQMSQRSIDASSKPLTRVTFNNDDMCLLLLPMEAKNTPEEALFERILAPQFVADARFAALKHLHDKLRDGTVSSAQLKCAIARFIEVVANFVEKPHGLSAFAWCAFAECIGMPITVVMRATTVGKHDKKRARHVKYDEDDANANGELVTKVLGFESDRCVPNTFPPLFSSRSEFPPMQPRLFVVEVQHGKFVVAIRDVQKVAPARLRQEIVQRIVPDQNAVRDDEFKNVFACVVKHGLDELGDTRPTQRVDVASVRLGLERHLNKLVTFV